MDIRERGGDFEIRRREGARAEDDGVGEAGWGDAGGRCCCGGIPVRRRGGAWRCRRCTYGRRGRRCAADIILDGRADVGDIANEKRVYESRFDLRAQRRQIRTTGIIPRDLHGEERGREVRNPGLVLTDDGSAQVGSCEFDRSDGANFLLDDGAVDGDTLDLI